MANRDFKKIKRTIQDFSLSAGDGNGNGGSVIVDALPANGVEGQTYLLRKEQGAPTSFKIYEGIYGDRRGDILCVSKGNEAESVISNFEDKWFNEFNSVFPDPDTISFIDEFISEEDFEESVAQGNILLIESLEDLPEGGEGKEDCLHYLGEFTNNTFKMVEFPDGNDESSYQDLYSFIEVNGLTYQFAIENNTFVQRYREIHYNNETGEWGPTEWSTQYEVKILENRTDELILDPDQFYELFDLGQGALITFTPAEITYTYTQYVFDKGVYTEISGSNGGMYLINIYSTDGTYPQTVSMFVDDDSLETYEDLYNYLMAKGANWSEDGFYPASAFVSSSGSYYFITTDTNEFIYLYNGSNSYQLGQNDFSIFYLGNKN